jgi:Subunit ChlI of Mg-chelatase
MLYKTFSAAVYGIDANLIEVEVDVSGAKLNDVHFHTVGLPDAAVRESQDRVRSALRNCGYDDRRPGISDRHRAKTYRRSDPVPSTGPDLLGVTVARAPQKNWTGSERMSASCL